MNDMKELRTLVYSREMNAMELLSAGFRLFLDNIKGILLGILMIGLPLSIVLGIVQVQLLDLTEAIQQLAYSNPYLSTQQISQMLLQLAGYYLILAAIGVFLQPILDMGFMKMTKWRLEERSFQSISAYAKSMLHTPTVILVGLVYAICIFVGSLILIPGIYLGVVWTFYLQCIALAKRKGVDALGHSLMLVRGRWWRTFGFVLLLGILVSACSTLVGSIFYLFPSNYVTEILSIWISYVASAFSTCVMTVLFLNRESGLFGMAALQEEEETQENQDDADNKGNTDNTDNTKHTES